MAKGNMLLGLSRGSVGDLTFYRRNAQQITRVRVRKVKNPQTDAQMIQRCINRTAVNAYSVLKPICDHSFEGVSYGANSYSRFLKLNMDMLRSEAANTQPISQEQDKAYLPAGIKGCVAMPFITSTGSIVPIQFASGAAGGSFEQVEIQIGQGVVAPMGLLKIATLPNGNFDSFTYKQFADVLGAKQGDQLTFISVQPAIVSGIYDEPVGVTLDLARVIVDTAQDDWAETNIFADITEVGNVTTFRLNNPNIRNEGAVLFVAQQQGTSSKWTLYVAVGVSSVQGTNVMAMTSIISRQREDGTWLRSNSRLSYNPLYRENGYTLKAASLLTKTDVYVESDYYLNNAE